MDMGYACGICDVERVSIEHTQVTQDPAAIYEKDIYKRAKRKLKRG